jgi:hypothetical protein
MGSLKKRQHMSLQVKLDAALIALGLDPASVEWHHQPALQLRPYEDRDGVRHYTPDENDPRYIVPMGKAAHSERYAFDRHEIDKTRRLEEAQREFSRRLLQKAPGDLQPKKSKWPKRSLGRSGASRPR